MAHICLKNRIRVELCHTGTMRWDFYCYTTAAQKLFTSQSKHTCQIFNTFSIYISEYLSALFIVLLLAPHMGHFDFNFFSIYGWNFKTPHFQITTPQRLRIIALLFGTYQPRLCAHKLLPNEFTCAWEGGWV